MAKVLIFLFSLIVSIPSIAQTISKVEVAYSNTLLEDSEIAYSHKPITWNDFQGKTDKNSQNVAMTFCGIKMRYEIKKEKSKVSVKIILCPYLDISESWYNESGHNDYTLAHEQKHFDIAGIVAQQLFEALKKKTFEVATLPEELKQMHEDYVEQLYKMQQEYDEETNHGINKKEQAIWNQKINDLIKKYFPKSN